MDVFKGILRHCKGNPSIHRIAKEMRTGDLQVSQYCDYIAGIALRLIGFRLIGLVTRTVAAGIDKDQPVIRLQTVDIAELVPGLEAVAKPVLHYERRAFTLN